MDDRFEFLNRIFQRSVGGATAFRVFHSLFILIRIFVEESRYVV